MTPAIRFLSSQVWAIHPPVFTALSALLQDRANGQRRPRLMEDDEPTGTAPASSPDTREPGPQVIGSTGVIVVRGVIARYADQINGACQDAGRSAERLQRDLLALAADGRVQRIVLRIDSPGGTVAGTAETADTIRAVSAGGKPVIAFVDGMAASAAYWLASQADEIVMGSSTSEVGSIGVIAAYVDETKAQDEAGCKVRIFRTAPLKAPGAAGETLSPDQVASIEQRLGDFHALFSTAVAAGRGLADAQLAAATSGELWLPVDAIAMGLADRVATWADVVAGAPESPDDQPVINPDESTPTAAAVTPKESSMDKTLMAALAALCLTHPSVAAELVAKANEPNATADGLKAFAAGISLKAKDDQIAAQAQAIAAKDAELAAEKAKSADLAAKLGKLSALAAGAPEDPGAGSPPNAGPAQVTRAEYKANPAAYADGLRTGKVRLVD